MHIAIIGAGINGLMSALELVEQGCRVTIIDQMQAGRAASWAGGGILSPMYPWRYPAAVNLLAQHAKPMYQAWNEKLKPVTGIDFQIHETGMLIFDESDFEQGLAYASQFHEPLQQAQQLSHSEIQTINPKVSTHFKQALYFSQLANIRNPRLLQSITCYLKQHPQVIWKEYCPIQKLHMKTDAVTSVEIQDGNHIHADHYVFATGAWSGLWKEALQLEIPTRPIQGHMLLFKTPPNWLTTMCMNKVMYLIPRQDGHVLCGSSMQDVGFNTEPNPDIQQKIQHACFEIVPALQDYPLVKTWAGLRPSSPDGIPYIGKIPKLNNVWANFGHFRNGLCMAPASAQLLRQLILGQASNYPKSEYDPALRLQSVVAHSF